MAKSVGILVPNLFLRLPVEAAVRACQGHPVVLEALPSPTPLAALVVDLTAVGDWGSLATSAQGGTHILSFAPHQEAQLLQKARQLGAVALPKSAFFPRLPELLHYALQTT